MTVLETERLVLRHLDAGDAAFIMELVNDPGWLRFIGDRNVRTPEDARAYIENKVAAAYPRHGFGMYLVERREDGAPTGICGLVKRDTLEDADVGFAFLPRFRGMGYAREAAAATLEHARRDFGMARVVAIVTPGNDASARLLKKLGMRFEGLVRLPGEEEEVWLFTTAE